MFMFLSVLSSLRLFILRSLFVTFSYHIPMHEKPGYIEINIFLINEDEDALEFTVVFFLPSASNCMRQNRWSC